MSLRLAGHFIERNPGVSYDQALAEEKYSLCSALCVINRLDRIDHLVDVKCKFTYGEGKYEGEVTHVLSKALDGRDLPGALHPITYAYIAINIDNGHCVLMRDLRVEVVSITPHVRLPLPHKEWTMSPRIAGFRVDRNPGVSYEEALAKGDFTLCGALCVVHGFPRTEHLIDVRCKFTFDAGKRSGEVVHRISRLWEGDTTKLQETVHAFTYSYILSDIYGEPQAFVEDLTVEVVSVTPHGQKEHAPYADW